MLGLLLKGEAHPSVKRGEDRRKEKKGREERRREEMRIKGKGRREEGRERERRRGDKKEERKGGRGVERGEKTSSSVCISTVWGATRTNTYFCRCPTTPAAHIPS